MNKGLAIGLGVAAGYLGAGFLTDTYRRQVQLNRAREFVARHRGEYPRGLLNLSCGRTSFGDVNADVVERDVPNFVLVEPEKPLPFADEEFAACYTSHTLEHSADPNFLLDELERVSGEVFVVLPDIWWFMVLDPSHQFLPLDQSGRRWVKNPFYSEGLARQDFTGNPLVR